MVNFLNLPLFQNFRDSQDIELASLSTRFVHKDIFGNQLVVIFVRRNHPSLKPCRFRLSGQRSDHVVRFVTRVSQNRYIQSLHQSINQRDLLGNIFRLLVSRRFVLSEFFVAKRRIVRIKGDCDVGRLLPLENVKHSIGHAKYGRSRLTRRSKSRAADHAKMGSVDQSHAIQQVKFLWFLLRKQIAFSKRLLFGHASGSGQFCRSLHRLSDITQKLK